jgi:ParB family transcriptional regulator, chromosome partitioning protein
MTHFQLSLLTENNQPEPITDSNDWYTPIWLIEAARTVMGGIDLDPASCARANEIVKAKRFYSKREDGLIRYWSGNVWLNPPYSMPLIEQFTDRLLQEWESVLVDQVCVLTRNATETKWCQRLLKESDRFCLLNKRVSFWHPDKPVGQDKCGHIIFYFGSDTQQFERVFSAHGLVFAGGGTQGEA